LAWGGEAGVGRAVHLPAADVELALGLAGIRAAAEASPDLLVCASS